MTNDLESKSDIDLWIRINAAVVLVGCGGAAFLGFGGSEGWSIFGKLVFGTLVVNLLFGRIGKR